MLSFRILAMYKFECTKSIITNDFQGLFQDHKSIRKVFFNGRIAEKEYKKHVLPMTSVKFPYLEYQGLPSTSPAMASMSKDAKFAKWKVVIKNID